MAALYEVRELHSGTKPEILILAIYGLFRLSSVAESKNRRLLLILGNRVFLKYCNSHWNDSKWKDLLWHSKHKAWKNELWWRCCTWGTKEEALYCSTSPARYKPLHDNALLCTSFQQICRKLILLKWGRLKEWWTLYRLTNQCEWCRYFGTSPLLLKLSARNFAWNFLRCGSFLVFLYTVKVQPMLILHGKFITEAHRHNRFHMFLWNKQE